MKFEMKFNAGLIRQGAKITEAPVVAPDESPPEHLEVGGRSPRESRELVPV